MDTQHCQDQLAEVVEKTCVHPHSLAGQDSTKLHLESARTIDLASAIVKTEKYKLQECSPLSRGLQIQRIETFSL